MKKVIQILKQNKHFLISTHVHPDPDAIGSELALAECLRLMGKKVTIVNEDDYPERLDFLPGIKKIKEFREVKSVNYDVAIIVDCGDVERIGAVHKLIDENKPLINIDHHITNTKFGTLNLVKPEASSTASVLFDLMKEAKQKINKSIAFNLYAGIMTDTGCFRYNNTTSHTHEITAELLRFGLSAGKIYSQVYETIPLNDLKEFAKIIGKFEVFYKGKVITMDLRKNVFEKFSEEFDLRDTIFKFLRATYGVDVFVIFTEVNKNFTRINLRSSGQVNVGKFASYFDGGGHHNASGCKLDKSLAETRKVILNKLGTDPTFILNPLRIKDKSRVRP